MPFKLKSARTILASVLGLFVIQSLVLYYLATQNFHQTGIDGNGRSYDLQQQMQQQQQYNNNRSISRSAEAAAAASRRLEKIWEAAASSSTRSSMIKSCDEIYFLQYPDIKAAIANGFFTSGFKYWQSVGQGMGRAYPCLPANLNTEKCIPEMIADRREIPKEVPPIAASSNSTNEDEAGGSSSTSNSNNCKLLWFSALHEGTDSKFVTGRKSENGYVDDYLVALSSANIHAKGMLQPILMIGRYKISNENSTRLSKFGKLAVSKGAMVHHIGRLTFQSDIDNGWHKDGRGEFPARDMATYLRLEIPRLVEELDLFNLPGVCKQHALYTDPDIVFVNNITHSDIAHIRNEMLRSEKHFIMYGPESNIHLPFLNAGVMVIDVPKLRAIWPIMREFANSREHFPREDQDWLNRFLTETNRSDSRVSLPITWNWKLYWSIEPYEWKDIKIIHTHGPKLGSGIENMILMNPDLPYRVGENYRPWHDPYVRWAILCNGGESAARFVDIHRRMLAME